MNNYFMDPSKDYDNSVEVDKMNSNDSFEEAAAAFYKATGYLMPGKDGSPRDDDGDSLPEVARDFKVWCAAVVYMKRNDSRGALLYDCAARLQEDVDMLMGIIIDSWKLLAEWRPIGWVDHACRECIPNGEILIDGFSCAYHRVKRIAGAWSAEQA